MKLRQISEYKLKDIKSPHPDSTSLYFMRPAQQLSSLYNPLSAHDAGARVSGDTQYSTGIPHKPRHRAFLGMEKRLGSIRL